MGQAEAQETGRNGAEAERKARQRRPSRCRSDMRKALTDNFDAIVKGFIEAAKTGSCPHVKLATELLKPTKRATSRKKGSVQKLMERLDWERLEREQEEREREFGVQRTVCAGLATAPGAGKAGAGKVGAGKAGAGKVERR